MSYVTAVIDGSADPVDVRLEQLKLEYFRRYQLDIEIAFYRNRSSDHRASAERTLTIAAWAVLVAAVASSAADILGALATQWAALGALAVFGTALQSFAAAREGVGQDRRNPARTADALRSLRARLDDVRSAVSAGNRSALVEYVGRGTGSDLTGAPSAANSSREHSGGRGSARGSAQGGSPGRECVKSWQSGDAAGAVGCLTCARDDWAGVFT